MAQRFLRDLSPIIHPRFCAWMVSHTEKVSLPAPACTSHGQQASIGLQQVGPRDGKVVLAADQVHAMRGQIVVHRAAVDGSVRGRRAVRAPCVLDVKQRRATRRRETGLGVLLTGDPRLVGADRMGGCVHRIERGVNDFRVVRCSNVILTEASGA